MKKIFKKIFIIGLVAGGLFGLSTLVFGAVTYKVPTPIALYEDSLQSAITSSATSFTLVRGTDIVGTSLASSTYGFIIDEGSASQEFVLADCVATACTNVIRGVSPITGLTAVTSLQKAHRRGAVVKMTDAPILLILKRLVNGDETWPNIISYVSHPTFTSDTQIVDKKYVDDIAISGSPDATTAIKGISKLSVVPVSSTSPIAVGDNDNRVSPVSLATVTAGQVQAMAGTSGTPSSSNKYVTDADTTGTGSVVRASGISSFTTSKTTLTAGASITAGQALSLSSFIQTDGGIIHDTSSFQVSSGTTLSHTVGNFSNRLLLVAVSTSGSVSAVTYNGVSMTLVTSKTDAQSHIIYLYKLVAPAVGTANISVTGTSIVGITGTSYYNVDQTNPLDVTTSDTSNSSAVTSSITTTSQGSLIHSTLLAFCSGSGVASQITYTLGSKYKIDNSLNNSSFTSSAQFAINSGNSGKINETVTSAINIYTQFGGGGTCDNTVISTALKPATAVSIGVVPTNTSAISFNEPLTDFIGFADSSVSINNPVSVTYGSIVTGLSGLTAGTRYYLQNTNGTLGTIRGTYGKEIGKAISSTTLLIAPQKTMGAQIAKAVSYTYTAESDGFVMFNTAPLETNTVITDGVTNTTQLGVTANFNVPMSVPVSRGKTYIFSANADAPYFIPMN